MEVLNDVLGEASFEEDRLDMLDYCRSLWRRLQDNSVTGQKSWDKGVNED